MAVASATARIAYLAATVGSARAASVPALFYMTFFDDDPTGAGVELSGGGFARSGVANTDSVWGPPTLPGVSSNIVAVESVISTGAWSAAAAWVGFMDDLTAGELWDYGPLVSPVTIGAADMFIRFAMGDLGIAIV